MSEGQLFGRQRRDGGVGGEENTEHREQTANKLMGPPVGGYPNEQYLSMAPGGLDQCRKGGNGTPWKTRPRRWLVAAVDEGSAEEKVCRARSYRSLSANVSNPRPLDRFNARRSIELRLVVC